MEQVKSKKIREDLIYPELSYIIVGCAFEVYNELGPGHLEKFYQKAFGISLKNKNLNFKEQFYAPLYFKGQVIGKQFIDIMIEDKIVVEIKKGNYFSKSNIDQVNQYLVSCNLQLALLINFGNNGVLSRRVLNITMKT